MTETVQVLAGTPLIDVASTTHQKNIPAEEFEVIPKGRSFQALATALPSVNTGELEGGFQVNGASAGENNFTVDGVSVVSQIHGNQRQDAVFEYLQEVQVKTSGLEAEYGGALGGVISAVTKSGGNTLPRFALRALLRAAGCARTTVSPSASSIDPVTQNTAYFVQDDDQKFNRNEFGGTIGGPIVRDHLFFFGSASPRIENLTRNYTAQHRREWCRSIATARRRACSARSRIRRSAVCSSTSPVCGRPTRPTGSVVAYDGATAESRARPTAAGLAARQDAGLRDSAVEHGVHRRLHARRTRRSSPCAAAT